MIVFEARRTRRIVGRLERGESVLDALAELAVQREFTSAWFQATGPLESAELAVYDVETGKHSLPRRVGACTAVQITGNLSRLGALPFAHAHALVVPARGDDGMHAGEPVAGELRAALSVAVEFVIEVFEDVVLDRMPDDATGLALWRGRATATVAASPAQLGWAAAAHEAERLEAERAAVEARAAAEAKAAASRGGWGGGGRESRGREPQRPRAPQLPPERVVPQAFAAQPIPEKKRGAAEEADEPVLEPGDWVAHKQFGLCRVDGEDAEGALVIRLPSGVRKSIRLDFLRVLPAHEQDGRRVFPLEPRRR
jgi:predicted DNA-binding protein with PD1-like motif